MDPSAYTKIVEIMSGKAIYQQGLVTTCKDRTYKVRSRGVLRFLVWRMSQYEQ